MIDVVSGAIIRDGRIFLTQRKHTQSYKFSWESAGGKVDAGEFLRAALLRELNEELDWCTDFPEPPVIDPEPFFVAEFPRSEMREDRTPILLHFFRVTLAPHIWPVSREDNGSGWFNAKELASLSLLPGNERALPYLLKMMEQTK